MSQEIKEKINKLIETLEQEEKNKDLDAKIETLQKYRNDLVEKVFLKIKDGEYDKAAAAFYQVVVKQNGEIDTGWLNTDSAVLAIMFKIHGIEMKNGEDSILRLLSSLDVMRELYFELKFLLRRFEYDLPYEKKEALDSFMKQYPISAYAICEMIELCISQKEKVLNEVAMFFFKKEYYEHVLPLLWCAYEKDQNNPVTLYHMAYTLYAFQEKETALQFIKRIKNPSNAAKMLHHTIEEDGSIPAYVKQDTKTTQVIPDIKKPETKEKIAFILCVNQERYFKECCYYIENLVVPEGYELEIIPIYHAASMTSGYEKGMKSTDAKYKIYIHQDVLCTNPYLLFELLNIFALNPEIGLVGVAGCIKLPQDGIWWNAPYGKYYNLYQDSISSYGFYEYRGNSEDYSWGDYQEVQALDGVFLATAKDVDWREDLLDGWHFYDISQSMEFQRKGYKVVIPKPHALWVLHNEKCGDGLGNDYRKLRIRFLKEYKEELALD